MDFLIVIVARGFAHGHLCNFDFNGDRVARDVGHTAANRLTKTCSLGLWCPYWTSIMHIMVSYLTKQDIICMTTIDHIMGSS